MEELLERSDELQALEDALASVRAARTGRIALVSGEAGIGKTSLVRRFCDGCNDPVLSGACEPLFTPRPLGPFVDLAEAAGGRLAARGRDVSGPADMVAALVDELRRHASTVLVVEDVHWADEATLDVVRMLGRRVESLTVLLVVTYRDEGLDRAHPARLVLGELPARPQLRLTLAPLSLGAVSELASQDGIDGDALARRTGGNPFFVTEVLAARGAELPATVRDAVLARAAGLGPEARALLDAVSIVPQRTEPWLLEHLVPLYPVGLDECLESGMLRTDGAAVSFRHEIARVAAEGALRPNGRVALHQAALTALAATERPDPARLAHHAEGAGDREAVQRHAPEAGERAAALGAHREAAHHFARALRHPELLAPARRAELYERRSYECYLTGRHAEAIEAREHALEEHRGSGNRLGEGDAHRWLSRLAWFLGDNERAEREAQDALDLLEALPPGRELAMAYSNVAQLRMLAYEADEAVLWGGRAIALAEQLGDVEIVAHALNTVGTSEYMHGDPAGLEKLGRSLELALAAGLDEHAARAYTNFGSGAVPLRDYAVADTYLEKGIEFCREHDLDSWVPYMTGWLARSHLEQGRWHDAESLAARALQFPDLAVPSRITPLTVVGLLRARRGDADPWEPLDQALLLARETGELQRLSVVAAARAEAHWLEGRSELVSDDATDVLAIAVRQHDFWSAGELSVWLMRAGNPVAPARDVAEPWALELSGDPRAAADRWSAIGCPYEAALSLAACDDVGLLQRSIEELTRLGASRAAARVSRSLRRRGVRGVRTGPRVAARSNSAGLTRRELDVLELLCAGLRNREIAAKLFLSEKTVHHHVSAILRKLAVESRGQAVAEAGRLGIARK